MKKYLLFILLCGAVVFSCTRENRNDSEDPAKYVNPMIGASTSTTMARAYHGLGKTVPGATTPFGAAQVSPNTITGGDNGSA
ncbi:hypothetical protein EZS27_024083 [termite gut metagenome]|uniref:Glycosyl hydrolase family 92 N-terminal domain-containing protein n=1 Tax=termite gut metagenome TaxID=433724 RepID=A0A5J4QYU8_9ZZZZ